MGFILYLIAQVVFIFLGLVSVVYANVWSLGEGWQFNRGSSHGSGYSGKSNKPSYRNNKQQTSYSKSAYKPTYTEPSYQNEEYVVASLKYIHLRLMKS